MEKYSLGTKAEQVYDSLTSKRQSVIDMGRRMAALTIPNVMPPEGYTTGDNIAGQNQSVSAMCVNTLTSHLVLMAFPPGQPIMDMEPKEATLKADMEADPELYGEVKLSLSRLEISHRNSLRASPLATAYTGYIKLLLIVGNALWKHLRLKSPTFHTPQDYVVLRNKVGIPLLTIHKETVKLMGMDADHVAFIMANSEPERWRNTPEWEREVDVYSVCRAHVDDKGDISWCYWEEWEGHLLPDTEVETDYDCPPMWPGWLVPVYGQNWGQSYCEQYRGDHYAIEALASAGNDLAALAALALTFVRPGGPTSIKQIREAENLSVLPGQAEDVTTFRAEKGGDAQLVGTREEQIARRLASAYLLQASIQRSGERVTAEEIKRLGQELDKAMGGLYTATGQGNQRVVIVRAVKLNEAENKAIPKLPRDTVDISITTGVDALGKTTEAENLIEFAGTIMQLFPTTGAKYIDGTDFARRLAAVKGIRPDGLVKTPKQVAEEDQQAKLDAMTMSAVDKGIGPGIKAMTEGAVPNADPGQ